MTPTDLKVHLYNSIKEDRKDRKYKTWNASAIAKCPREQYYKLSGVKPIQELTGAKIMRFKAGDILEDFIRPHLLKKFPKMTSNQRFTSKKLNLTGEYDNYDPESKSLIEIKSVHVFAPKKLEKDGQYYHQEYQQHALKLLLEENNIEVESINYVYIALDGQICVFNTQPDPDIESNVLKRLALLNEAWKKQEPPMCLCKQQDHPLWNGEMRWCDYRTIDPYPPKVDENCCDIKLIGDK